MKLLTDIILTAGDIITDKYMFEYNPADSTSEIGSYYFELHCSNNEISNEVSALTIPQTTNIIKSDNEWYYETPSNMDINNIPKSRLRLYFPQYSVECNLPKAIYMLTASTHIHGRYINLGCYKFKKIDALACSPRTFGSSTQYFEYKDFELPDLYSILYKDCGENIRQQLGCPVDFISKDPVINLSLYVVDEVGDKFIKSDQSHSGQNSIIIKEPNYLSSTISYEFDNDIKLSFDVDCDESFSDVSEYIQKTYDVNNVYTYFRYVIMDENDIYYTDFKYELSTSDHIEFDVEESREFFFTDWNSFKPGLIIRGSVSFIDANEWSEESLESGEFVPFITIFTNRILLDQELYAKLLIDSSECPIKIELNDDMNVQVINQIKQVESPIQHTVQIESSKSKLIQPVFFQTKNIGDVTIHPNVTENIAINIESLNTYKPYVSRFNVQVEGVVFKEIGRTTNGIIFKIIGKNLPKEVDSGTLYILDQNLELVTTGLFNYVY